jgi:hypothetical protein
VRGLAVTALLVLAVGGVVQLGKTAAYVAQLHYGQVHPSLHTTLDQIEAHVPAGAVYANTPSHSENLRYTLFPRLQRHVNLYGDEQTVRDGLLNANVQYVVITSPAPPVFAGEQGSWWKQVWAGPGGRVIEVHP